MKPFESDWVFNLMLKLAVIICLCILALSLTVGASPLTALLRSGTAFVTFAGLGWATALVWQVPELELEHSKEKQSPEQDASQEQAAAIDSAATEDETPSPEEE